MASMRDIQRRKQSIESTEQITKAMKLVATVRLQKARAAAEKSKPYFEYLYKTVNSILSRSGNIEHRYFKSSDEGNGRNAVIVITANRGLAGGYNNNVVKLLTKDENFSPDKTDIFLIGKKGGDILLRNGYSIKEDYSDAVNDPIYRDAMEICEDVLTGYENGDYSEIYVAYTKFKNTVVHIPEMLKLLPVDTVDKQSKSKEDINNKAGEISKDNNSDSDDSK